MDAISLLREAQVAYSAGKYDEALEHLSLADLEGKLCPESMLLKAACVQLASNTDFSVNRALDIYLQLLRSRPLDPRALTELAYFLLNVKGDTAEAHKYFVRSVGLYRGLLVESLVGLCNAEIELGASVQDVLKHANAVLIQAEDEVRDHIGQIDATEDH